MTQAPFRTRPATANDISFILSSWLKKYRDSVWARLVTDRVYYERQHAVIRKILEAPGLDIRVACDPDDDDLVFGYVVGEHLSDDWVIIHWCYTKAAFRRFNIAKSLLKEVVGPASKVHYSHRTYNVKFLDPDNKAFFNCFYVWSLF